MTTVEHEPFEFIKAEEGSLDSDRNFNCKLIQAFDSSINQLMAIIFMV